MEADSAAKAKTEVVPRQPEASLIGQGRQSGGQDRGEDGQHLRGRSVTDEACKPTSEIQLDWLMLDNQLAACNEFKAQLLKQAEGFAKLGATMQAERVMQEIKKQEDEVDSLQLLMRELVEVEAELIKI